MIRGSGEACSILRIRRAQRLSLFDYCHTPTFLRLVPNRLPLSSVSGLPACISCRPSLPCCLQALRITISYPLHLHLC